MSENGAETDNDLPMAAGAGGDFDAETGEVYDRDDDRVNLEEIAVATATKLAKRELTIDQINERRAKGRARSVANFGWFPKVPALVEKDGKVKREGSRITGQIVAARTIQGRFGVQQVITIFGRCSAPTHKNSRGTTVPKIDSIGRWNVGVDSSLSELPDRVGEVVDIQFKIAGGNGKRHTYERVDVFDMFELEATAPKGQARK